jgi:hypothetical protein
MKVINYFSPAFLQQSFFSPSLHPSLCSPLAAASLEQHSFPLFFPFFASAAALLLQHSDLPSALEAEHSFFSAL